MAKNMSVQSMKKILGLGLCGLILAGCSGTKELLGLEKTAPDEFAVYSRAPLSLPPDYSLKPPTPGAERPQEEKQTTKAQRALLGQQANAAQYADMTPGFKDFLSQTGALNVDPSIRQTIDRETSAFIAEEDTFVQDLMFWKDKQPFGSKIDPALEAQRIREAQALGQPIDGSNSVVIERKEEAILEGIFN